MDQSTLNSNYIKSKTNASDLNKMSASVNVKNIQELNQTEDNQINSSQILKDNDKLSEENEEENEHEQNEDDLNEEESEEESEEEDPEQDGLMVNFLRKIEEYHESQQE